jgi:hypothetical protein
LARRPHARGSAARDSAATDPRRCGPHCAEARPLARSGVAPFVWRRGSWRAVAGPWPVEFAWSVPDDEKFDL